MKRKKWESLSLGVLVMGHLWAAQATANFLRNTNRSGADACGVKA